MSTPDFQKDVQDQLLLGDAGPKRHGHSPYSMTPTRVHRHDALKIATYLPVMPIETMTLHELLQSLGTALNVPNLNFATNAAEEIENLKIEDPALLNSSAYSIPVGAVYVVMVEDTEGGPAFSSWHIYSFFVEHNHLLSSKAQS